jgi:hypothetical protein
MNSIIILTIAIFFILIGLVMAKDEDERQYHEDKNN